MSVSWTAEKDDAAVVVIDDGPVRRIVLNRPGSSNAIDQTVCDLVEAALDGLEADPALRVGLVAGNGRHFCAGMDLRQFLVSGVPRTRRGGFGGIVERRTTKPLVAAVHGAVLAGGLEIALACDVVVAARGARFGLPEVGVGLVAAAGGLIRLPQVLPRAIALRAVLTGEPIDAETAWRHGLVTDLVDETDLAGAADALARRIAGNAPLAVAASKRVAHESYGLGAAEAFALQAEVTDPVFASADAREGAAAFAERRSPQWTGH